MKLIFHICPLTFNPQLYYYRRYRRYFNVEVVFKHTIMSEINLFILCRDCIVLCHNIVCHFRKMVSPRGFPSSAETTAGGSPTVAWQSAITSKRNARKVKLEKKRESNGTLIAVIVVACISSHHDVVEVSAYICEHDDIVWGEREVDNEHFFVNNCCMMIRSSIHV